MASKTKKIKNRASRDIQPGSNRQDSRADKDGSDSFEVPLGSFDRIGDLFSNQLLLASFLGLVVACAEPMISASKSSHYVATFGLMGLFIWSLYTVLNKRGKKDYWSYGVPALMFFVVLFSYYSNIYGYPLDMDNTYFSIMAAIFAFFFSLSHAGKLKVETSMVAAIFIATLLLHLVPANADILSNLDSYWHYKWMQIIYNTGYPPEYDPLVYPMFGGLQRHNDPTYTSQRPTTFGLDQKGTAFMMQLTYTSFALAGKSFGISLYDVAMLFPGILAALAVVMMYLLVKDMFAEMQPYNQLAAFAAAFMFMLSPALAMNATATNCEDDSFGMFLMVASIYLFFASYQRKSFKYSLLCGLSFLMLRMGWSGTVYTMLSVGGFCVLYAVLNFFRNRNCLEHLPYLIIPVAIYQLSGLFTHGRGLMPVYAPMAGTELYPVAAAIGLGLGLELIRARWKGMLFGDETTLEGKVVNLLEKNIQLLGGLALLAVLLSLVFYKSPMDWVDFIINQLLSPAQKSLVHQTVSEQNPMATNISEFVNDGYQRYGIALLYGLLMIPVLAYFAISRGSVGSLFVLTWSLPMMWGAYNKSAYIFTSSAPVTALGATIALLAAVKKEDLEGLRIIGTILVVCIPIFYVPMLGLTMYNKFVGYVVMHMGPTSDIYYWQPALEWHRDHTNPGDAVLTWWDYGHWFTAVSHRPVLIDNLQADYYEIQDVARFFVNKTTEEDAFETVKAYNSAYKAYNQSWGLNYATIDWTMIGKGSALHYIATGSIENASGGSWKNYIQCDFDPDNSQLDEKLVVSGNGSFSKVRKVMYNCQGEIYLVFTVEGYDLKETTVMTRYGNAIPWSTWMKSNDASILGVEPLLGLYERGVPSILACAINYRELPGGSVCRLPQFNTLIYVPQEFQDFMMTRLYLGKYMKEYRELGLYNREPTPLKHFREVPDYNGDGRSDGEFSFGFVRSYEISYEGFNATQTSVKDANGTAASESG